MLSLKRRQLWVALLAALVTLASVAVTVGAAGDDPNSFLRDRISLEQDVKDLLRRGFVEKLYCREDCVVKGRLVISSADAQDLEFKKVRRGRWFEIGRFEDVELEGGRWHSVTMPLSETAKRILRREEEGVRINGQNVADSLESGAYGWANWVRTCPWPRD